MDPGFWDLVCSCCGAVAGCVGEGGGVAGVEGMVERVDERVMEKGGLFEGMS